MEVKHHELNNLPLAVVELGFGTWIDLSLKLCSFHSEFYSTSSFLILVSAMWPFMFTPCSSPAAVCSSRVSGTGPLSIGFWLCPPIGDEAGERKKNQFLIFPPPAPPFQHPRLSFTPPNAPNLARHRFLQGLTAGCWRPPALLPPRS